MPVAATGCSYGDPASVPLDASDFDSGGLLTTSFARPGKLFTAHAGLFVRSVGVLNSAARGRVLVAVMALFQPVAGP
jgi:mRNA interferase MazF